MSQCISSHKIVLNILCNKICPSIRSPGEMNNLPPEIFLVSLPTDRKLLILEPQKPPLKTEGIWGSLFVAGIYRHTRDDTGKKKCDPWKKIHVPWKKYLQPLEKKFRLLWSCGPLVLWSCGPLVLWFWSCGRVVLWPSGPVAPWQRREKKYVGTKKAWKECKRK